MKRISTLITVLLTIIISSQAQTHLPYRQSFDDVSDFHNHQFSGTDTSALSTEF